MGKAIVDPEELRLFARDLKRFNNELKNQLTVLNGMLCAASNAELRRKLDRLAREFDQLNREDAGRPFAERKGYTLLLALRDWRYESFGSLRSDRTPEMPDSTAYRYSR